MNTSVFGHNPGFPVSVHTAPPNISIYDAARLMGWRNVGVIVVVKDHQPVGIVTDRDLATRGLGHGLDARSHRVARVMTTPILTMRADESDEHIAERMRHSRIRQIPLVDADGQLVGLAAVEESGDGSVSPAVVRSTVLIPMVKRKRWRRLVFRLKHDVAANLRWIGATVALAAVAGVVSLVAVGHWTPWTPKPVSVSHQSAARADERDLASDPVKARTTEGRRSDPLTR